MWVVKWIKKQNKKQFQHKYEKNYLSWLKTINLKWEKNSDRFDEGIMKELLFVFVVKWFAMVLLENFKKVSCDWELENCCEY